MPINGGGSGYRNFKFPCEGVKVNINVLDSNSGEIRGIGDFRVSFNT